jgi:hypothetical protein
LLKTAVSFARVFFIFNIPTIVLIVVFICVSDNIKHKNRQ